MEEPEPIAESETIADEFNSTDDDVSTTDDADTAEAGNTDVSTSTGDESLRRSQRERTPSTRYPEDQFVMLANKEKTKGAWFAEAKIKVGVLDREFLAKLKWQETLAMLSSKKFGKYWAEHLKNQDRRFGTQEAMGLLIDIGAKKLAELKNRALPPCSLLSLAVVSFVHKPRFCQCQYPFQFLSCIGRLRGAPRHKSRATIHRFLFQCGTLVGG